MNNKASLDFNVFTLQYVPMLIDSLKDDYQNINFIISKPKMRMLAANIFNEESVGNFSWDNLDIEAKQLSSTDFLVLYNFLEFNQESLFAIILTFNDNQKFYTHYYILNKNSIFKNNQLFLELKESISFNDFLKISYEDFNKNKL